MGGLYIRVSQSKSATPRISVSQHWGLPLLQIASCRDTRVAGIAKAVANKAVMLTMMLTLEKYILMKYFVRLIGRKQKLFS